MVAFAPEITLTTSQMLLVPVFPPKMLLRYVFIPARVDDAAGAGVVQLGLYRVTQSNLISPTPTPKTTKHEFVLMQRLEVSYWSGSLASQVAAVAGTSLVSLQSYTRIVGRLPSAFTIDTSAQYAIGIRPVGTYDLELPSPHLLVDAPSYVYGAGSTNTGQIPGTVVANSRERTPILTLLSPRGAYILSG